MEQQRTVAVTGASGFVGRHVVGELLSRGWAVRALVRDRRKGEAVLGRREGLVLVQGDIQRASAAEEVASGASAMVHLVGIIREAGGGQTFRNMHVEATRRVLSACRAAGVDRYVHMSALGVGPEGRAPYQKSKFEAEVLVRHSGLDWTILRPSLIHGPEGEFVQMASGWVRGESPPWLFLPYFGREVNEQPDVVLGRVRYEPALVSPVAVEDVARAFAEALERPESIGEIYNLVGPETLDWRELLNFMRDVVPGAKPALHPVGIPGELASLQARAMEAVGMGSLLPFDSGMALMSMEDSTGSPAKAEAHLGISPRPFRETVRGYASRL